MDEEFRKLRKKIIDLGRDNPEARFFVAYFFAGYGQIDQDGKLEIILDKGRKLKPTDRLTALTLNGPRVTTFGVFDCFRVSKSNKAAKSCVKEQELLKVKKA